MKNLENPDLAVILFESGGIIAATFDAQNENIQVNSFPISPDLHNSLKHWRAELGLDFNIQTVVRLAEPFFTAQTKLIKLSEEVLALDDVGLTSWMIEALKFSENDVDGFPIFESSTNVYDFVRTPEKNVALTGIPQNIVSTGLKLIVKSNLFDEKNIAELTEVADEFQPVFKHFMETKIRAATRYLHFINQSLFEQMDETVILAFSSTGASLAFWNNKNAFYSEIGEVFLLDYDVNEIPTEMSDKEYLQMLYSEHLERFLNDQVYSRLSNFADSKISVIITLSVDVFNQNTKEILDEFFSDVQISHQYNEEYLEESVVKGLILATVETIAELVPPINLAFDLQQQSKVIQGNKDNELTHQALCKKRFSSFLLFFPIIITFGICFGIFLGLSVKQQILGNRDLAASAELSRLKPIVDARANYEKTLHWYEDVLKQIIDIKAKQGIALTYASTLDKFYPLESSFYISEIGLKTGGVFEIKGFTKDESAVTQFYRTLEFSETEKQGEHFFKNLQIEFKQGDKFASQTGNNNSLGELPDEVSGFIIKGEYSKMTAIKTASNNTSVAAPTPIPATPKEVKK